MINRVAIAALMVTGLSQDIARFQARSAYYGVGFTTNANYGAIVSPAMCAPSSLNS